MDSREEERRIIHNYQNYILSVIQEVTDFKIS